MKWLKPKLDEEDLIAKEDEFIRCKCLHCDHEQNVPSWLIDEVCEMDEKCDLDDHFITGCYRCNHDTMVTMEYYNFIKNK